MPKKKQVCTNRYTLSRTFLAGFALMLFLGMPACTEQSGTVSDEQLFRKAAAYDHAMAFVPPGEFQMGSSGPQSLPDERPVHTVYVSGFYIDRYEVTNAQYRRFVLATGRPAPRVDAPWAEPYNWSGSDYPPGTGMHPAVLVSWHDAAAYAAWAGKRLPTEAEWEKAARAGITGKNFPLGDRLELNQANYFKSYLRAKKLRPVGSYEPNALGLHDMAGNVWEWCRDWYGAGYYKGSGAIDPQGPPHGDCKVFRGGAWMSEEQFLRCSQRGKNSPDLKSPMVGFRCVRSADQPEAHGGSGG